MCQKKVLHIMNGAVAGGISMTVLNMYVALNHDAVHFDCAVCDPLLGQNGKRLEENGCSFYTLPIKSHHPIQYYKKLKKIIIDGDYDAVHVHHNWSSYYPLMIARHCGVKLRIAHAHSNYNASGFFGKLKMRISHSLLNRYSTKMVACTKQAAEAIFGRSSLSSDKLVLLKNCINIEKFAFNNAIRNRIRNELQLDNNHIIGCVGNLGKEKNIEFALHVVQKLDSRFVLLLIGDGEERNRLEALCDTLEIKGRVLFLGRKENVNEYLQAIDIFLMPSLYEGFGIAALEAATSGLPLFLSSNIPDAFSFYSQAHYLNLEDGFEKWADVISEYVEKNVSYDRLDGIKEIRKERYDLEAYEETLNELYEVK